MLKSIAGAVVLSLLWAGSTLAETRSLKFLNLHTKERAEIVYKVNGRYSPQGLQQINHVLRDWRKNEVTKINPRLLDVIWQTYRESGASGWIEVICGYRSPATNSMLRSRSSGVAKESQHTRGNALDFHIQGVPLKRLREIGLKMQAGGVGFYPSSGSPFVHFDVGSVRHWPRMNRQQLASVFPDGRTIHVPSDGKPLPGYKEAQAMLSQRGSAPVQMAMAEEEDEGSPTFFERLFARSQPAAAVPVRRAAAAPARPAPVAAAAGASEMAAQFDVASARRTPPVVMAEVAQPTIPANIPIPSSAPRDILIAAVEADVPVPRLAPSRSETVVMAATQPSPDQRTISSSQVSVSALAFRGPTKTAFDVVLGAPTPIVETAALPALQPATNETFVAARIASAFDGAPMPETLKKAAPAGPIVYRDGGVGVKGSRPSAKATASFTAD